LANGLFQRISGQRGEIRIEALGVLVGTIVTWTLTRRGDGAPGEGLYDLFAAFSYVNPHLLADADYPKTISVEQNVGPGRKETFRLEQEPGYPTQTDGRTNIRMEGVRLCQSRP
jgi:hypothetical protein